MGVPDMHAECLEYVEEQTGGLEDLVKLYQRFEVGRPVPYMNIVDFVQILHEALPAERFAPYLAVAIAYLANKQQMEGA